MNPWEVVGWLLVVVIGLPAAGLVLGALAFILERVFKR